jgi:hypothetical protein
MSVFIQRGSVAFWMPHGLWRTLAEAGKHGQISGKESRTMN